MRRPLKLVAVALLLAILLTGGEELFKSALPSSTKYVVYDDKGCPMTNYGRQYGVEIGLTYNPLTVGDAAISYYESFRRTGDPAYKDKFLHCVSVLIALSEKRDGFIVITYPFPWKYYGLPRGWASCMSQSAAVLAFYEAYLVTGNSTYKELAEEALKAFTVPVERGGLAYVVDGGLWYEEYAHPNSTVKPFVLNGFLYSLIRLYQYYNMSGDREAKVLFEKGLLALKKLLPRFDTGSWTRYDLVGTDAPWVKHELHVVFLKRLYMYTGDKYLYKYYKKFAGYETNLEGIKHFLRYYIPWYARVYLMLGLPERIALNTVLMAALLLVIARVAGRRSGENGR